LASAQRPPKQKVLYKVSLLNAGMVPDQIILRRK
jgi:hypothetical protein